MAFGTPLSALPQWHDFAGIANSSLSSLGNLQTSAQWFLAEPNGPDHVRVLLCSGEGPLHSNAELPCPTSTPQSLNNGVLIGLPLPSNEIDVKGYLGIWRTDKNNHLPAELPLLEAQAGLFTALLNQLQHSQCLFNELEQVRMEADTDPLTGLLNRRGWNRLLAREEARCQRYGNRYTLLVVDINGLKQVNHQRGHYVGDRLVRQVAQLLKNALRQPDIVARIGGDEFAILLTNTDALHARGFEKRMTELFAQTGIQATSGKASWQPGEALQDTLCRADRAMCANKSLRQSVIS